MLRSVSRFKRWTPPAHSRSLPLWWRRSPFFYPMVDIPRMPFLIEPITLREVISTVEDQERRDLRAFQQLADWFIQQETPLPEEEVSFLRKVQKTGSEAFKSLMDKLSWSTSHQKQEVDGKVNSELHEAYFLVPAPPEKNKEIEYYHLTLNYKFEDGAKKPVTAGIHVIEGKKNKAKEEYDLVHVEGAKSDLNLSDLYKKLETFGVEKLALQQKDTGMFWSTLFHLLGKNDLLPEKVLVQAPEAAQKAIPESKPVAEEDTEPVAQATS